MHKIRYAIYTRECQLLTELRYAPHTFGIAKF